MADTLQTAQEDGRAPWQDEVLDTKDFVVYNDGFPVTPGHSLIVPKTADLASINKCFRYALEMGNKNVESDANNVTGYNVGINMGESAGQTCMYPHVHLILRRDGDAENPRGGIRHCVPGQGDYTKIPEDIEVDPAGC